MRRRRVLQMIGAAVPAFAARPMRLANAAELDEVRVDDPDLFASPLSANRRD